jgi:hypothetical protein
MSLTIVHLFFYIDLPPFLVGAHSGFQEVSMDKGFAGRSDLISGNCGYASSTGVQNETYQVYNAKEQRRSVGT